MSERWVEWEGEKKKIKLSVARELSGTALPQQARQITGTAKHAGR